MSTKPIYVTKPSLAPLNDFTKYLEKVWETGVLTHNGPLVQELESKLADKLSIKNLSLVTNGTLALQIAIKALALKGEIITTPFSWVATVSAIKWEGCTPVFCDIDAHTLNIDVTKIESLITPNTVAILPVHVFGNPCDVKAIENIANKYNLKVIYDAAHAIGTTCEEASILEYGDISTLSLHGTKLFNTAEGGACITSNQLLSEKIKRIRFFGHDHNKNVVEDGFNGKMTEIHAALGLANLKNIDETFLERKKIYNLYLSELNLEYGIQFQKISSGTNYSYFPIIVETEELLLKLESTLNKYSVFPRRYFFPSLNEIGAIVQYCSMPISESVSRRILCLPLYNGLEDEDIKRIALIIKQVLNEYFSRN